jgi:hypothetical protein
MLEDFWRRAPDAFSKETLENADLNTWIENYVLGISSQLEKIIKDISFSNIKKHRHFLTILLKWQQGK